MNVNVFKTITAFVVTEMCGTLSPNLKEACGLKMFANKILYFHEILGGHIK